MRLLEARISALRERVLRRKTAQKRVQFPQAIRLPVVPTPFGILCALLLLVILIWAINYQLNLAYGLCFLLAMSFLLSAFLTTSYLSRLQLECFAAPPVFAGDKAQFPLHVTNSRKRPQLGFWVQVAGSKTWCAGIGKQSDVSMTLPVACPQRGIQPLPGLQVSTDFPLGIFVSWQWIKLRAEVLVYPKPEGDAPLPFTGTAAQSEGARLAGRGGDSFAGLDDYQRGESLARIAWKQSQAGHFMVKRFQSARAASVSLRYQALRGNKEQRLSQLCAWVLQCEAQGIRYSLELPQFILALGNGPQHKRAALRALAVCP